MAPSSSAKGKRIISGPMPLLSRHTRSFSDAHQSQQDAIAEEYRAIGYRELEHAKALHTRSVSTLSLPAMSTIPSHTPSIQPVRQINTAYHLPRPKMRGDEFRLDVGSTYQSYILAVHALNKKFVGGVSRTSKMFVRAIQLKREHLLALPEEVRLSQAFEQAWNDTEIWESLFTSHCDKIRPGIDAHELQTLFLTAQTLLESTWSSVGTLIHTCYDQWLEHKNSPVEYARANGLPIREDEEAIAKIRAALESSVQSAKSQQSLAKSLISRLIKFSCKSKVPKQTDAVDDAEDDISSVSSFTLIENFYSDSITRSSTASDHSRTASQSFLESLDASEDLNIMHLNLSLRESKLVFASVASQFAVYSPRHIAESGNILRDEKGSIVLATPRELVRVLTDQFETIDSDILGIIDAFFLFFREFMTPKDLFRTLRERFEEQPPPTIEMIQMADWVRHQTIVKLHVVRMISTWLDRHYLAAHDATVLPSITRFVETVTRDRYLPPKAATLIQIHLQACSDGEKGKIRTPVFQRLVDHGATYAQEYGPTGFENNIPVLEKALNKARALPDILIFCKPGGAEELARAFTVIESDLFHRCSPLDFMGCTEKQSHPIMDKMQRWFNAVDLYVSQSILERRIAESRAKVFELFVEVAVICKNMRNYSTALSLLLGLGIHRVTRLRETMSCISERHMAMLAGIRDFFYLSQNFQSYRDDLRSQTSPAVPLLVTVKGDIIKLRAHRELVQERYKSKIHYRQADKLVDVQLYRKLRDMVRELESCYAPYKLPSDGFAIRWVYTSIRPLADVKYEPYQEMLFKESEAIEPPPPVVHRGSWVQDELWELGFWN